MFSNYLKIAIRNFMRNKLYSLLNILGLSVGIVASILILIYVQDELSYDKHHSKYKRIYRISSDFNFSGKADQAALTAIPLAHTMMDEFPEEIEMVCRFMPRPKDFIKYEDKEFYEENIFVADSTVFDMFDHKFIMGTKENALNAPYKMVMTESMAKKYFGDDDPIGKVITANVGYDLEVVAIVEDVPENSHMKFDALVSMATMAEVFGEANFNARASHIYWSVQVYSYILLSENADIDELLRKYPEGIYDKYMASIGNQISGSFNIMAHNLADIHLYSDVGWDLPTGNLDYIIIFSYVGICILLIACINYMNLATARSAKRAREVGIRKVLGAGKALITRQFLAEAIIMSFIALVIAVCIALVLLGLFNEVTGKSFEPSIFLEFSFIIELIILTILVGAISGSYPAFYLSSINTINVLKGDKLKDGFGKWMRTVLVVVQFAISTAMIIGTILVTEQLDYMQSKDIGFKKENVLVTAIRDTTLQNSYNSFREKLLQNPKITSVATAATTPGGVFGKRIFRVESNGQMNELVVNFIFVDYDYQELMELELVEGRFFDREMGTDVSSAVVVNERAAEVYGWGDNPLGKKVHFGVNLSGPPVRDCRVIGVVKDFNFMSLKDEIDPIIILLGQNPQGLIHIRTAENDLSGTIDYIKETREEFGSPYPFDFEFMDDIINENYIEEEKMSDIFKIFAVLCIFISCLGLLGLSAYIAELRTKEIGIRKVLGASVTSIVNLLTKDFIKIVLISNLIAWPVSYFLLEGWLNEFAFSIDIALWYFYVPSLITMIIAILTVSVLAIKAAVANPVDSIKYE
jgi:putative ABC transport system permease protein